MKLSLTEDYLSKVLESAYSNTICEWQAQGISDKETIKFNGRAISYSSGPI